MKPKVFKPVLVADEELMTVLVYETQYELMYSLARFQEFYENPVLRGTVFARQAVQAWQPDYYVRWSGCNFPARVSEQFRLNRDKWKLDAHEAHALTCMPVGRYIVGIHLESGNKSFRKTLLHERAHALFDSSAEYRMGIRDIVLQTGYRPPALQKLEDMGYHEDVTVDEVQAYAVSGWEKLEVPRIGDLDVFIRRYADKLKMEDA